MKKGLFCFFILIISYSAIAQHWASLGTPIHFDPRVIYADTINNALYVGGNFDEVGGVKARGIARWNGLKWDSLGTGMDNDTFHSSPQNTYSICRYQNYIYAGGGFSTAGNISSPHIARWNGVNWEAINGCNEVVINMHVFNNELYVSGAFDSIAGISANGIATWDGNSWKNVYNFPCVQGGFNQINDFTFYNGQLYVCGLLYDSSGNEAQIANYDGTKWNYFNFLGTYRGFYQLTVFQGELYAAGLFTKAEGNPGNSIIRWDGTTWNDVGDGTDGDGIYTMRVNKNKLYVCGQFFDAGNIPAQFIAIWDGEKWCSLGSNFNQYPVFVMDFLNDTLYVGGGFDTIDGRNYNGIAKWIGGDYVDNCSVIFSGVNNLQFKSDISIFPNPANSYLQLSNLSITKTNVQYFIINTLGQVKQTNYLTTNKSIESIDVSALSSGVYFIRLTDGEGWAESSTFVKE